MVQTDERKLIFPTMQSTLIWAKWAQHVLLIIIIVDESNQNAPIGFAKNLLHSPLLFGPPGGAKIIVSTHASVQTICNSHFAVEYFWFHPAIWFVIFLIYYVANNGELNESHTLTPARLNLSIKFRAGWMRFHVRAIRLWPKSWCVCMSVKYQKINPFAFLLPFLIHFVWVINAIRTNSFTQSMESSLVIYHKIPPNIWLDIL